MPLSQKPKTQYISSVVTNLIDLKKKITWCSRKSSDVKERNQVKQNNVWKNQEKCSKLKKSLKREILHS